MARFSGDWEKEFRPQWELKKLTAGAGQVGGASDPKAKAVRVLIRVYLFLHSSACNGYAMRDYRNFVCAHLSAFQLQNITCFRSIVIAADDLHQVQWQWPHCVL